MSNKKVNTASMKVMPGAGILGTQPKLQHIMPRQMQNAMAHQKARDITNNFITNHNAANMTKKGGKGGCGCGK